MEWPEGPHHVDKHLGAYTHTQQFRHKVFPIWYICSLESGKICCSAVEVLYSIIEADSIEQYGRGEIVRIFGVEEKPGHDVFANVVSVAEKAGVVIGC